ncbi:CPBP family intramembrane glutamic endopeptidase [Acaryochloris sp. IP29b_bin.148]|uniref:CPBP family intramembrane glutamic endopeptidase n=1 Tax=Acaryochloris sp. IP29b_bin.148 TaxID=2969218 RepID=UPI002608CA9F|nr:CPBP family intramembrane glutamic endopeptidase [Acaryochloris sp. IP29b_bin.148]
MAPQKDSQSYLAFARLGKGEGWRYILGVLAIAWTWWNVCGYVGWIGQTLFFRIFESTLLSTIVGALVTFVPLLLLLCFIVYEIHQRPLQTLVNAELSIHYRRIWLGFGVWWALLTLFFIPNLWISPQDYTLSFQPGVWFAMLPIVLILTPIQTSVEELFYRGYLMQGLSLLTRNPVVLTIATSLAFAIPHFNNPEMQRGFLLGALNYFLWGVFAAVITLKDNGLELALGVHAANNLFIVLILNLPDSVLPTPSIWTYVGPIHAGEDLMGTLLYASLFYLIFFGGVFRRHPPATD